MNVIKHPEYSKLLAIATRINMATTSVEISNAVLDMLLALENKPMEARVLAYCYTDAALVAALSETAVKFAQDYPDKISELSHAIIVEWDKLQKELDTLPGYMDQTDCFSDPYLNDFDDEVSDAKTRDVFESVMSKIRPFMEDTTSMGLSAHKLDENALGAKLVNAVIPQYLTIFPEDKLTADQFNLWHYLESITGASTISAFLSFESDDA